MRPVGASCLGGHGVAIWTLQSHVKGAQASLRPSEMCQKQGEASEIKTECVLGSELGGLRGLGGGETRDQGVLCVTAEAPPARQEPCCHSRLGQDSQPTQPRRASEVPGEGAGVGEQPPGGTWEGPQLSPRNKTRGLPGRLAWWSPSATGRSTWRPRYCMRDE